MLILVASLWPVTCLRAQDSQATLPDRTYERLGDSHDTGELSLDISVPTGEQKSTPETAEQLQAQQQEAVAAELSAARKALQEGRIDQPPSDCAWSHYRAVLDIDPQNVEALEGLREVQRLLISRALSVAKELDFETADRMLEDAAMVQESPELIQQAREDMADFRMG